jgi:phosphoribosylanthranilate isomerase
MIRVKICGLTRLADARLALDLGADALGFILWPNSPRAISVEQVRAITRKLPPFVARVGVFVDQTPEEVRAAATGARLDVAQLHGDEDVGNYTELGVRIVRGMPLIDDGAIDRAVALPDDVMPLVDASDRTRRGGTGRLADWDRAARLARQRPIVLAGGITPENVAEAVRRVRPWGLDVSSGVEDEPGIKNADRLRLLFGVVTRLRAEGL